MCLYRRYTILQRSAFFLRMGVDLLEIFIGFLKFLDFLCSPDIELRSELDTVFAREEIREG